MYCILIKRAQTCRINQKQNADNNKFWRRPRVMRTLKYCCKESQMAQLLWKTVLQTFTKLGISFFSEAQKKLTVCHTKPLYACVKILKVIKKTLCMEVYNAQLLNALSLVNS